MRSGPSPRAWQPLFPCAPHKDFDRLATYSYPLTENQFSVHTTGAVSAARGPVHLRDEASKSYMTNCPSRRRSRSPGVVAGLRDCEDSARNLYRQSFVGHYRHRCVSAFGRTTSFFFYKLRGTSGEGQLGLELCDPLPSSGKLCVVGARKPRFLTERR